VRDLLGVDAPPAAGFEPDAALGAFTAVGAARIAIPARQVEKLEAASFTVAGQVFGDPQRRQALVGCTPTGAEDACVRRFLAAFARRAFRRPVAEAELAPYVGIVAKVAPAADVWSGLSYAVAGLLQSTHFLYRSELGEPQAGAPGGRRLTGHEVATRLAYLLTGSTPDDLLLDAADAGALAGEGGIRAAADRLLASPRAEGALMRFFSEHFGLGAVATLNKDPRAFARFSPDLAASMSGEIDRALRALVFQKKGDLTTLFVSRETFVNRPLAELYGLPNRPAAGRWEPVTWPADGPRGGLLGFAGLLALHAGPVETSPTKRGHFVSADLLCREVPEPPPEIDTTLPPADVAVKRTMRDRVAQHMSSPSCRGCHLLMDPYGLALEHFDALGAHRATEDGLAIDARGELDGKPFADARGLGALLAQHPDVAACVVRRFYQHATGALPGAGEAPALGALAGEFRKNGHEFLSLVRAVVTSDAFRYTSAPR
jgi:hypothetical protein